MSPVTYEVIDLVKRYRSDGPAANDGISLTINQGEVFGLLGPNGAGKSTLVRQMAALSRPTSGQVILNGYDLVREPHRAGQVLAVQPQGMALPVQARPLEVLEVTGRLRGLSRAEALHETEALLEQFHIAKHRNKRLVELSGGLRRLVAIASTLIGHRSVLIFDEPTNDLDPEVRRVVWDRIRQVARQGATVVLVTHNVVEAEQALDRLAIIRNGRILALGSPAELKAQVSRQVRLELFFRPGVDAAAALADFPDAQPTGPRRFRVTIDQEEAEATIARLLPHLSAMDDFRIVTPNLEDVYLTLSGGERLAQ